LKVATARAITILNCPKFWKAAQTVTAVPAISVRKMTR
jgi:hypothetical protein